MRIFKYLLFLVFICPGSLKADGVLEINQTCALNGGCFSGDTAGFPVTINGSAGRSYRLTGDLDLSAHPTVPAISISDAFVTLDLNGFEIAGVATCELAPGGFDWDCEPRNPGAHGIELTSDAESVTIKNGTIRNMPDDGIAGADTRLVRVDGVTLSENAGWGVLLGHQSMIANSRSQRNDFGGFKVQNDANISHSVAYFNGGVGFDAESRAIVAFSSGVGSTYRGFSLGPNSEYKSNTARWQLNGEAALCGGGVCSEKKRFYLTQTQHQGNDVLGVCENGFHTASLWEIHDPTELTYDYVLGRTEPDSGLGSPGDNLGWIRNSHRLVIGNCDLWTVNTSGEEGSTVALKRYFSWGDPAENSSPWVYVPHTCDETQEVWCVED